MLFDLISTFLEIAIPLGQILLDEMLDDAFGVRVEVFGEGVLGLDYFLVDHQWVQIMKWVYPHQ